MMLIALVITVAAALHFMFWTLSLNKENTRLREKDVVREVELEFAMDALERALDENEDQRTQLKKEREFLSTFNKRLDQLEDELELEEYFEVTE